MMRDYPLNICNLSSNVIAKIPPKLATNFNQITELNLSFNKISALPEEISQCRQLLNVDISHNSFISLPNCVLKLPKITEINAKKNFIAEIDVEDASKSLESLNLEENPLTRTCQNNLSLILTFKIHMTSRELEEWEDLSI